jgi:hypothetical protein
MLNLGVCGVVKAETPCSYTECIEEDVWEGEIESKEINFLDKIKGFFKLIIKLEKDDSKVDREVWLFCVFRF